MGDVPSVGWKRSTASLLARQHRTHGTSPIPISPPSLSMLRHLLLKLCTGVASCEGIDSIRPSQPTEGMAIEVGPHPRRHARCPLESSNGAPHRMRSLRRFLSFIGEAPAAQLRRRMTTGPYVTTHFFQALTLNSPWCSLLHDGGGMTRTDPSTPPAALAALGDGCARTGSSGRGSAGPPLARIAKLRPGCCPPPASLTPLACGCCKPPLNRAS